MREVFGNLWQFAGGMKCITTNGSVRADGNAVMGRGCANEARLMFHGLAQKLGTRLRNSGNHVYYFPDIPLYTFPVKVDWNRPAVLTLIEQSAYELVEQTEDFTPTSYIYLPRPGCGNGTLMWEDVRPVIEPILTGDRFRIVDYARGLSS